VVLIILYDGDTDVKEAAASCADATAGAAMEYCTGMENEAVESDVSWTALEGLIPAMEMPSAVAPYVKYISTSIIVILVFISTWNVINILFKILIYSFNEPCLSTSEAIIYRIKINGP
jgi:hypothetical protein